MGLRKVRETEQKRHEYVRQSESAHISEVAIRTGCGSIEASMLCRHHLKLATSGGRSLHGVKRDNRPFSDVLSGDIKRS
jgi:hypothetical protein